MNKEEILKAAFEQEYLKAKSESIVTTLGEAAAFKAGIEAGANIGAEAEAESKWVEFESMTKKDKIRFNSHPQNLIICQFDNGDILRYDEDFPVASLVKVIFLPKP